MSDFSKTLPKCTRTTVIDHLFQRQYNLTYSETIIMAYLMLLHIWATNIDDYYLALSSKMRDDLLLGIKTIEATFTKFKKLGLIEIKLAQNPYWKTTKKFRTIKVTEKGKKYNLSYHKQEEYQHSFDLEKENEDYQIKNSELTILNSEIKTENIELGIKLRSANSLLEAQDNITQDAFNSVAQEEKLKEKITSLERDLEEARAIIKKKEKDKDKKDITNNQNNTTQKAENKEYNNIDIFRRKIIKEYSSNSRVLCNGVEGWHHDINFYINTYNRVTIKFLTGDFKQLTDLNEINAFWEWLFKNQNRVGIIIKEPISPNIIELMEFEGKNFTWDNKEYKISKIIAVKDGVNILIKNEEKEELLINNDTKTHLFSIKRAINGLKKFIKI